MRRGYETTDADTYKLLLEKAKEMRKMPTEAESLIWKYLATNKTGFHFRRQHPICGYIPDFVCIKKRLIVEIDGGYHFEEEQPKIDAERTKWLNNNGYKVIRFTNQEVMGNTKYVLDQIKAELEAPNTECPPFGRDRVGVTIVKVGGAVVEDEEQLSQLLKDFSAIEGRKVLVHGGGRRATKVAAALGVETKMVNGRRITDADMLEVVTMVYGGLVNKNIVTRLQAQGINALGLTGADMNVIRSHKRPPITTTPHQFLPSQGRSGGVSTTQSIDFGFVGDVDEADGEMLQTLIEEGVTPVMAPLTHDGKGNLLNTNADTIAAETAKALADYYDVTLIYSFEKKGVLRNPDDDDSVIPVITREDFQRYVADGTVAGGMIPKLENAFDAIDAGVSRVIITLATAIDGKHGTVIK